MNPPPWLQAVQFRGLRIGLERISGRRMSRPPESNRAQMKQARNHRAEYRFCRASGQRSMMETELPHRDKLLPAILAIKKVENCPHDRTPLLISSQASAGLFPGAFSRSKNGFVRIAGLFRRKPGSRLKVADRRGIDPRTGRPPGTAETAKLQRFRKQKQIKAATRRLG
jgi:hypothetical protein